MSDLLEVLARLLASGDAAARIGEIFKRRGYRQQYAVLLNRTPEEILEFAAQHDKCFVFAFFTRKEFENMDVKILQNNPQIGHPAYVGEDLQRATWFIKDTVTVATGGIECEVIRDETPVN